MTTVDLTVDAVEHGASGPVHAVIVNEAHLRAYQQAAALWAAYRPQAEAAGRTLMHQVPQVGDLVMVRCDDQRHARWLADYFVSRGMPKPALQVVELPSWPR